MGAGAVLAAFAGVGMGGGASASQVTVAVNNPGGSRTLFVEDLLGQPLTTLDFGTTRAHPFRVRVVDTTMDRSGFAILTSMSNLYKVSGNSFDFGNTIPSGNVSVDYPTTPVNALSVAAIVEPVFNMTETVTGPLCTALTTAGGSCSIALSAVNGLRQTASLTVDLSKLLTLPIVPQVGDSGSFASPDFNGIGANDPSKPASFTPTTVRVLGGGVGSDPALLTDVKAAVQSLIAGSPASSLVDSGTLTGALRSAIGGPVYDALTPTEVQQLVDGLQPTLTDFLASQLVAQSGTYLSYPSLHVNVPTTAPAGNYQGTLVVTAVQL
ncbi:MAG TPA: hypothetical protein VFA94_15615 [Acidimicrobiales bacterium]|nr:hypothetical protein [Acidimicrobiales bacterium]